MVSSTPDSAPYFHSLATFVCCRNRLYRIYVLPDELVLIWAGDGSEGVVGARVVESMGLAGGMIGGSLRQAIDPTDANAKRRRVLDSTPLSALVDDDPRNIRVKVADIESLRILPPSTNYAYNFSDYHHQALIKLRHRVLGKFRLGVASVEDVAIAIEHLPKMLADRCRVEVEWADNAPVYVPLGKAKTNPDVDFARTGSLLLRTSVVGLVLASVLFTLFLIVALIYGTLTSLVALLQMTGMALLIGSVIPIAVAVNSHSRLRIRNGMVEYVQFWLFVIARAPLAELACLSTVEAPYPIVLHFRSGKKIRVVGTAFGQQEELIQYVETWVPGCEVIRDSA